MPDPARGFTAAPGRPDLDQLHRRPQPHSRHRNAVDVAVGFAGWCESALRVSHSTRSRLRFAARARHGADEQQAERMIAREQDRQPARCAASPMPVRGHRAIPGDELGQMAVPSTADAKGWPGRSGLQRLDHIQDKAFESRLAADSASPRSPSREPRVRSRCTWRADERDKACQGDQGLASRAAGNGGVRRRETKSTPRRHARLPRRVSTKGRNRLRSAARRSAV